MREQGMAIESDQPYGNTRGKKDRLGSGDPEMEKMQPKRKQNAQRRETKRESPFRGNLKVGSTPNRNKGACARVQGEAREESSGWGRKGYVMVHHEAMEWCRSLDDNA